MESVIEIARMILIVGGALCVLALFVLLLYVISIIIKVKTVMKQTQQTYEQAMTFALSPLQKLTEWFSLEEYPLEADEEDLDEEDW